MRGLKITMFILGVMLLGTQTLRHVYVKWLQPEGSVLDEFRDNVERDIDTSEDLDDLVTRYREARRRGENAGALRHAIEVTERRKERAFEVWFFWLCGLLGIVLGMFAYRRIDRWLGMAGIIAGFAEMAWWTSPIRRYRGSRREFDDLLTLQLTLSLVALALLITLWLRTRRKEPAPPEEAF